MVLVAVALLAFITGQALAPATADVGIGFSRLWVVDAADVAALRKGTTEQAFRVYETFTNSTNYSRVGLTASSGNAEFLLQTAAEGTGTLRNLTLGVGARHWQINSGGNLVAITDGTPNIGALAATRPANIYASTGFGAAGIAGASATVSVRDAGGLADCNLVFTGGLYTSTTC